MLYRDGKYFQGNDKIEGAGLLILPNGNQVLGEFGNSKCLQGQLSPLMGGQVQSMGLTI